MLKIGTRASELARRQAEFTQAELRRIGAESEVLVFDTDDQSLNKALRRGDINVAAHDLKNLPTLQPEGLVITALSNRDNPAELLLIQSEAADQSKIFKLKAGATVGATAAHQKVQLRDIRPDIEIINLTGDALAQLRAGACNAILLPVADVQRLDLDADGLEMLELNPREFTPAPGQGVLAWQTHRDDLSTRRLFKQLHHPEVSVCTNVERKVLQLLSNDDSPLGIFVEHDAAGNFHAFAALELDGTLRRARLSQSTSAGLADRILALLHG